MHIDDASLGADPLLVAAWVKGWALSRGKPPPTPIAGGFRVDVEEPDQRARYIFARATDDVRNLADAIDDPLVFLKICAAPETVQSVLPAPWTVERLGFLMTSPPLASAERPNLPMGYVLDVADDGPVVAARILAPTGVAASGRIAVIGDLANFDRIATHADHRRRGLASAVMRALSIAAAASGITRGALVATPEGRALYHSLGWSLHSLYTTAAIATTDAAEAVGPLFRSRFLRTQSQSCCS